MAALKNFLARQRQNEPGAPRRRTGLMGAIERTVQPPVAFSPTGPATTGPTQAAPAAGTTPQPQGAFSAAVQPQAAPLPDWIQNIQAEQARNPMGPMPAGVPLPAPSPAPTPATPAPPPFVQNIQNAQAANPMGPNQPAPVQQPLPRPLSEQGAAQTWNSGATAPTAAPDPQPMPPQTQGALSAAAAPPAAPAAPPQTAAPGALSSWADPATAAAQLPGMAGAMQQATTYSPSENALVSNNLTKLLAKDNPYMTLARTKAAQYANSRGLLNSSMAAGAGERAAIESALPIAQQDASSYFTADRDNAGVLNAFSRDANEFGRAGALTAARAGMDMAAQRESQAFTTGRDTAQFGQRMKEIEFSTDQALRRYDAEQGSRLGDTYRDATTAIYDQYSQDATRINESDMDPAVKTAQLGELKSLHASRQTHLNTVFAEQPRWRQEWAQFALEFAETEGA